MRIESAIGYTFTAFLYLLAWWNPSIGPGEGLVRWVSFEKFCLAEFLTCHATTLLGGFAMAATESPEENWSVIFWILLGVYVLFGAGAFLFHQDRSALIGFYLMLAIRGLQLLSMRNQDLDIMRAQVVKNFAMTVPMMFLVGAISMSDDGLASWQDRFVQGHSTLSSKILSGLPLFFVAAYYLLWAVVEWKWPLRIKN